MASLRTLVGDLRRRLSLLGRRDAKSAVLRHFHLLRRPKRKAGQIRWQGRTLLYADGPSLYCQLGDIFADNVYDFSTPAPAPRILDVGGNLGLATLRLRQRFPSAEITTFEPDPELARLLRRNLDSFGDSQSRIVAAAAWTCEDHLPFAAAGDDSGSLNPAGRMRVPTVDLASYCERPVDFMKLDVEGAEYELLAHLAATGALARVRRVFIELHVWDATVPRFHEVLGLLAQAGFNYRLSHATTRGALPSPGGFTAHAFPANLVIVHAWQEPPASS